MSYLHFTTQPPPRAVRLNLALGKIFERNLTNFSLEKTPERKHRKIELLKLMAARSDFSGSKRSCRQLLENAPTLENDLNYPLTVAAIVCYARPFTKNEPYGALPKKYLRSMGQPQKDFHKLVLEARHEYFAHSDLKQRNAYVNPKGTIIAKEPIELRGAKIGSSFSTRLYHPSFFEKLMHISVHMHEQVYADIENLLEELYGGMELPDTKFKIRIDNGL